MISKDIENICEYCPLPEENRGCKSALVNCEGSHCQEALENYKSERGVFVKRIKVKRL